MKNQDYSSNLIAQNYDNWDMYTIEDRICVDFVGRYENLIVDFSTVCDRIGLPVEKVLPAAKTIRRRDDYRKWYGKEDRKLLEEIFRKEIEAFNYSF